jgi:hypothetical protein
LRWDAGARRRERTRIWLVEGVAAVAALLAAAAFGVSGSNTITTIGGTGIGRFSGDGRPATSAMAVDGQGRITTFAGGGVRLNPAEDSRHVRFGRIR